MKVSELYAAIHTVINEDLPLNAYFVPVSVAWIATKDGDERCCGTMNLTQVISNLYYFGENTPSTHLAVTINDPDIGEVEEWFEIELITLTGKPTTY